MKLGHLTQRAALLVAIACGLSGGQAFADNIGERLAWKYHCTTCHGDNGKSNASRYPHIAGQNAAYLESRLRYFRSGEEPGNQMNAQAAPLSDEEIKILSEHFSAMAR